MKIIHKILLPTLLACVALQISGSEIDNNHKALEQTLIDSKKQLAELEKTINHKIKSTVLDKPTEFHPIRLCIIDLIRTTISAGELRYKIDTINNPLLLTEEISLPSNFENNFLSKITSSTQKMIINGLELFKIRHKHTIEEKNKAHVIIAELKKQQQKLIKEYQEKTNILNISPTPVPFLDAKDKYNYEYDMRKFDKAIHEQQIITEEAILPYLWNTDQRPLNVKRKF